MTILSLVYTDFNPNRFATVQWLTKKSLSAAIVSS